MSQMLIHVFTYASTMSSCRLTTNAGMLPARSWARIARSRSGGLRPAVCRKNSEPVGAVAGRGGIAAMQEGQSKASADLGENTSSERGVRASGRSNSRLITALSIALGFYQDSVKRTGGSLAHDDATFMALKAR